MKCSCRLNGFTTPCCLHPTFLPLPLRLGRHRGWCACVYVCVQLLCDRFPEPEPSLHAGKWWTVATTGQFYSAPGWMLNLYLMYDISHKSSRHRHDPGVFRRLLFQCLSNCGIIRPSEKGRKRRGEEEGGKGVGGGIAFEFGEMISLSLLWPS